jgi:hypothetical protein
MHTVRPPARAWVGVLAAGLTALGLAGCNTKGTYPVSGQLLWEGKGDRPLKELAGFEVTFTSLELKKMACGMIKEDGSFQLVGGAEPGEYQVIVTQPHRKAERPGTRDPIVALEYEDPAKTPLKETVKAEENHFTLRLKPIQPERGR